jgi:hypothetical protein
MMRKLTITIAMISVSIGSFVAPPSQAAIPSPMTSETRAAISAMEPDNGQLIQVRVRGGGFRGAGAASRTRAVAGPRGVAASRTTVVRGPRGNVAAKRTTVVAGRRGVVAARGVVVARPIRPWIRRAYYGTIVAGVTLGTIIAATAIPPAPSSAVCWYWSNSSHTRGYWDYCQPQ